MPATKPVEQSATATGERYLLRVLDVDKTFHMGEVDVPVLHDITLHVHSQEFLVIVGPSGSGKSTLLNLIGGLDRPTNGEVWFKDLQLTTMTDAQLTYFRRQNVGFVFQFYNLVPTLTAIENVMVSTELAKDPMDPMESLALVHLEHRADHFPAQLSGGEQQRVAIARALAKRPELLLCDEPTGALDFETGKSVLALLNRLNRELGMTIILITHNTVLGKAADRVIRLRSGRIAETQENETRTDPEELMW